MNVEALVREHYRVDDIEGVVLNALRRTGADIDALRVEDLGGLDQLHAGSTTATESLLEALDLAPDAKLLDVGCGLGGPARLAAARYGCSVVGIDLSPDFIAAAGSLTERLDMTSKVSFEVGSATELPFEDGSFTRAMLNHVGMNIAEKARVFAEVRRVLDVVGLFGLHEQMRFGDGELPYPLPWAVDSSSSFVETRSRYAELLAEAGFVVEREEDRTAANAASSAPAPGQLGLGDLFGPVFKERLDNTIVAIQNGMLHGVLMVARAV